MGVFDFVKNLKVVTRQEHEELKKGVEDLKVIQNYSRPEEASYFFTHNRNKFTGISDNLVTGAELYQLAVYSDILQNVLTTLKNELFRNGFDIQPITSFENEEQKELIKGVLKKANNNNQSLKDVLMELENDLNIMDDAYLLIVKNYLVNFDDEIIGGEVQEIMRVDPLSIEIMHDSALRIGYDEGGQPTYFDPYERTTVTNNEFNKDGFKNLRACYKLKTKSYDPKTKGYKDGFSYYDTSEVLHVSKYRPSKLYGFSPLYSLYNKVMTLINMDYYIRQYYSGNKVPKGILTVNTSNASGFWTFWDSFIEKVRRNPHSINPLIHQSPEGKDPIKWIDFMRNLQEMQYTEVRNEIRSQIGALYYVSPIFQNDLSTGGGLNNEGLQITVTNKGAEFGQSIYNEKVLPFIFQQLGYNDYEITLKPSEEQDEVHEKDLRLKELQIAKATADLGIKTRLGEDGQFIYTPGDVDISQSQDEFIPFNNNKSNGTELHKAIKPTQTQVKEIENALSTELGKILKQFDLKTRPTKKKLQEMVKKATDDLDKALKTKNSKKIKAIYEKAMKDVGKEVGKKLTLNETDKNVIEALKRDVVYQKAFKGLSKDISKKLTDSVERSFKSKEGVSIDNIVKDMRETLDESEGKLRTIARTESTKISVAARKNSYAKTGEAYKYFHVGPNDDRTTIMSKEAEALTKNGVEWDEYVKIIKKVSRKYNPNWKVNPDAPITHPNTRHTFIARRV